MTYKNRPSEPWQNRRRADAVAATSPPPVESEKENNFYVMWSTKQNIGKLKPGTKSLLKSAARTSNHHSIALEKVIQPFLVAGSDRLALHCCRSPALTLLAVPTLPRTILRRPQTKKNSPPRPTREKRFRPPEQYFTERKHAKQDLAWQYQTQVLTKYGIGGTSRGSLESHLPHVSLLHR